MKPTSATATPYVFHHVHVTTGQPGLSFPPPPAAKSLAVPPLASSLPSLLPPSPPLSLAPSPRASFLSSSSSTSSPSLPRLDGPARPLRKRNREPLPRASAAATFARRPDPAKLADAFRHNLRTASQLPDGALEGLVRNLVTDRAQGDDHGDLHLLLDVLLQERDRMAPGQVGEALRGLVAGLGGAGMATSLMEVLVDRVVCMGMGDPGRCIQEDLRALTRALVQGEHRLDRLGKLVDLVMEEGLGLRLRRLGEALSGIALGLQAVSTPSNRIDPDLHQRMLVRILRPEQGRTNTHVRAGLIALWEHLAQAGALTPAMRNTVLDQVFDCREAAGPRLMSSACKILTECLSQRGEADAHRTALLGTLVRESVHMTPEETFQAAVGLGAGLGGARIDTRTRAWMAEWLVKLQRLHPGAAWASIYAGLAYTPATDDTLSDDKAHASRPTSPPAQADGEKPRVSSSAVDAQALWEVLALDDSSKAVTADLQRESKHSPGLGDALDLERREASAYLQWRDRHARKERTLASSIPIRSHEVPDLVPPQDQARLRQILPGLVQPHGLTLDA